MKYTQYKRFKNNLQYKIFKNNLEMNNKKKIFFLLSFIKENF